MVAVIVTPGSTALVASVTVPVSTASCASAMAGEARRAQMRKRLGLGGVGAWGGSDWVGVGWWVFVGEGQRCPALRRCHAR